MLVDGSRTPNSTSSEKYLGDILESKGGNLKNIKARAAKGYGVVNKLISELDELCLGPWYFEVALIMRNAYLINSMLTNGECWYNITIR